MTPTSTKEHAAAEMVGALMLISVIVVAFAVIAVFLFSQPPPEKMPAVAMTITNESRLIEISHGGGDVIPLADMAISVDDQPVLPGAWVCSGCSDDFSIGDIIRIDYTGSDYPNKIDMIYKKNGQNHQILTTRYLGTMTPTPTPYMPPTTPTPTPTLTFPPAVTSITPAGGPTLGGTIVTITGTDFTGASLVMFGGSSATAYTVNSDTSITATSPVGTGTVDITVTTSDGTSATSSADKFTYGIPAVTGISPSGGPTVGGTSVLIVGTDFTGATAVKFGSAAATTYTVNSDTQITATSPTGTGIVDITVTTSDGTSATSSADKFTYGIPAVTSISPAGGPTGGGTIVTITGTDFTGAIAVRFGNAAATAYTVNSATQITATSPAGTGTVDITITTALGTSATSSADQFTFGKSTVTGVSPAVGPNEGGIPVTITGTGFTGVTSIKFGTTAATSFTVNNATSITVTSPAHSVGTVDVTVTTPGGISATSSADQFTYHSTTVTKISPAAGVTGGGTIVTITGTGFTGTGYTTTAVMFGTTEATTFTVNSATKITATSPAGSGTVDITVSIPGDTSPIVPADQFSYGAPVVTSISPISGPTGGNTVVTITGTGFNGVTSVKFGSTNAKSYTVNSVTKITATAPSGSGTVDIRVTTPGGTSLTSSADQFTYAPVPTISSLSPAAGPTGGGTSVTITGTGFTGTGYTTTAVKFGSTAATTFTVNSATSITATAPAGSGTVSIQVITPGGTSANTQNDNFVYAPVPTVTKISPVSGTTGGNTVVTITGTGFSGTGFTATTVKFGSINAKSFTVNSATKITATSPAGSGTVDITVTTTGGTSLTSSVDQFKYI